MWARLACWPSCGSGAHVFVSDSEISKNTGHFNNEIDFAGSKGLIGRSSWRLCGRTDEGRLSREFRPSHAKLSSKVAGCRFDPALPR